jgi:hypothetical protein
VVVWWSETRGRRRGPRRPQLFCPPRIPSSAAAVAVGGVAGGVHGFPVVPAVRRRARFFSRVHPHRVRLYALGRLSHRGRGPASPRRPLCRVAAAQAPRVSRGQWPCGCRRARPPARARAGRPRGESTVHLRSTALLAANEKGSHCSTELHSGSQMANWQKSLGEAWRGDDDAG